MELETVRVGSSSIITVVGEVDGDNAYALYLTAIEEASGNGSSSVVLDLAGVTFIDSVGLGMLVRTRDELADQFESALVLRSPSPRLMRMLDIVALTSQFTIEQQTEPESAPSEE